MIYDTSKTLQHQHGFFLWPGFALKRQHHETEYIVWRENNVKILITERSMKKDEAPSVLPKQFTETTLFPLLRNGEITNEPSCSTDNIYGEK